MVNQLHIKFQDGQVKESVIEPRGNKQLPAGFSFVEQLEANWLKTDVSFSVLILHPDNGGFRLRSCSVRFISVNCSETTYDIHVSF